MTFDIVFCLLAGVVSCVTPQALLLLPLLFAAAGTRGHARSVMIAVGLGVSLVLMGALAVSMGVALGFEAVWLRRLMCAMLIAQGFLLMSGSLADRYPLLTGGRGGLSFEGPEPGGPVRVLLLALFVGANWIPRLSPSLGKATLMAADTSNFRVALAMLFVFGMGAALPWIAGGRVLAFVTRPFLSGLLYGPGGKKLLGLLLLASSLLGLSGMDIPLTQLVDGYFPEWARKLSVTF